jgi:ceramide glucosyltransferase
VVSAVAALQGTLLVLIAADVLWTSLMLSCTWAYFARRVDGAPGTAHEPGVSIIKPTKGVDQSAFENFSSFCHQEYGGDHELLFCVEEPSDPAVPVIRRLIETYPDEQIRLIVSDTADAPSFGKLKNMIAGVARSSYDVVVFSDSDARVPTTFLRDTVACTRDPALGIAFGAPEYAGSEDWRAALTSISVNQLALPITTLHVFGLFDGAIGTTMVARKEVIEEVGGLEQLGWHIADDIQLARLIRRRGYRIHLLRQPARVVHQHDSFSGWWAHRHRWLVIIRHYWPALFALMNLVDLALWWGLALLGISLIQDGNVPIALGAVLVALTTTVVATAAVNAFLARNEKLWRFLWVVLVQELLRLPLVLYSLFNNDVVWRGRRFRVLPDGTASIVGTTAVGHRSARD